MSIDGELVSVESTQTVLGREPKKALAVLDHLMDCGRWKTFLEGDTPEVDVTRALGRLQGNANDQPKRYR